MYPEAALRFPTIYKVFLKASINSMLIILIAEIAIQKNNDTAKYFGMVANQ
jgi:hypothetical protein